MLFQEMFTIVVRIRANRLPVSNSGHFREQVRAELRQAQAALELSEANLVREEKLVKTEAPSRARYDEARGALARDRARVAAAEAQLRAVARQLQRARPEAASGYREGSATFVQQHAHQRHRSRSCERRGERYRGREQQAERGPLGGTGGRSHFAASRASASAFGVSSHGKPWSSRPK